MQSMLTSVSRQKTDNLRQKDMDHSRSPKALEQSLREIEEARTPVMGRATDYPSGWHIEPHQHSKHQLIHAVQGVMVVQAEAGRWVAEERWHASQQCGADQRSPRAFMLVWRRALCEPRSWRERPPGLSELR